MVRAQLLSDRQGNSCQVAFHPHRSILGAGALSQVFTGGSGLRVDFQRPRKGLSGQDGTSKDTVST
ncbi:hypothetical protein [Alcanivorax sp.]|uniref:hypothetical protein n=1 Tax=Alcanivorax sp. TaxID=1872427 RepID=UPI0025BA4286|nr:hypothetical protein [Alcanivorax sp.]